MAVQAPDEIQISHFRVAGSEFELRLSAAKRVHSLRRPA